MPWSVPHSFASRAVDLGDLQSKVKANQEELLRHNTPSICVYRRTNGSDTAFANGGWEVVNLTDVYHSTDKTSSVLTGAWNSADNYIQVEEQGVYTIEGSLFWNDGGVTIRVGCRIIEVGSGVVVDEDLRVQTAGLPIFNKCHREFHVYTVPAKFRLEAYWDGVVGSLAIANTLGANQNAAALTRLSATWQRSLANTYATS